MNPRLPFTSPTLVALRLPSLGKSEVFFPLAVKGRADSRRLQGARRQRSVSRILAAGYQEAFTQIKDPIGRVSFLRTAVAAAYLFIAASFFMAAVQRRKKLVFGLVLLASLIGTAATAFSASYLSESKNCCLKLSQQIKAAPSEETRSSKAHSRRSLRCAGREVA